MVAAKCRLYTRRAVSRLYGLTSGRHHAVTCALADLHGYDTVATATPTASLAASNSCASALLCHALQSRSPLLQCCILTKVLLSLAQHALTAGSSSKQEKAQAQGD
jgi:hypothetical protein